MPTGNPLDDAPQPRSAIEDAIWECFLWVLRWSGGMGGVDVGALRACFEAPHPGSWLEPEVAWLARQIVPELVAEQKRIQAEKYQREREERDRKARARRKPGDHENSWTESMDEDG